MNPYAKFVAAAVQAVAEAKNLPLGGIPAAPRPTLSSDAPRALFFAPHPDDETISGGLALRLLREAKFNVINVAVTQGSKKERQAARLQELQNACAYLGFGVQTTGPNGLERVTAKTRQSDPQFWANLVQVIAEILIKHQPRVIFFPHERDWNGTHIGVHHLVMDALHTMLPGFECHVVETEFWGAMDDPNLAVEISAADLADLIAATSFHVGEVQRNPYHLSLPAWMMDNVRRGAELVGGQGGAAPQFTFAALYRRRRWTHGGLTAGADSVRFLSHTTSPATLFA
jgi:LmbE family N-acetylglucosaminyl deacetylase